MSRPGLRSFRASAKQALTASAGVLVVAGIITLPPASDRPAAQSVSSRRAEALRHARTRLADAGSTSLLVPPSDPSGLLNRERVDCQFVPHTPGGTSFKFDCALANGEIVRVKYGHEPEIHAEVAATRLLAALGYATDHVYLVPQLRCRGCPLNPFVTMLVFDTFGAHPWMASGSTDFEWVAVERKFEAPAIEDEEHEGWAWWELDDVQAPREELDALRLLAVFLAHWDNKAENQRLVCMDENGVGSHFSRTVSPKNDSRPHFRCTDPLLMIQDVGSTFGPAKVNLSQWRQLPIWIDRASCTASMRAMPFGGSTFADVRISDAARRRVGRALAAFSDEELRSWFAAARFPQFYSTTDDRKDLDAWVRAYRSRVSQILDAGPCPS